MANISNIEEYLKEHENKDMLRFLTCGSVDDGKSTLIGRMLYDSKMIFDDQLAAAESESKKYGTTGEKIDMALFENEFFALKKIASAIDQVYRTDNKRIGHDRFVYNKIRTGFYINRPFPVDQRFLGIDLQLKCQVVHQRIRLFFLHLLYYHNITVTRVGPGSQIIMDIPSKECYLSLDVG